MTNILSISCIHNDIENMINFIDKISLLNVDVIVCTGDFTDYYLPRGFTREDLGKIVFEELKYLKKPIVSVPGGWDKELVGLLDKMGVSIHGKGKIIDGLGFYGYGGAKTPFNTPLEPSEEEIGGGLRTAYKTIERCKIKIQVTHAPPARTKLDIIASGAHVGSEAVRKIIEEKQPHAAICSHIHEGRGVDEIGRTKIVNSGRFPEGHCGLISVDGEEVSAKTISLI